MTELFGRPHPVPDDLSEPYWKAAADHILTAARCSQCHHFCHPPDIVCVHCGSTEPRFEFVPLSGKGTVRTWTVMRQSFLPGFEDSLPFVLVDVELVEDPDLRLIGRWLDDDSGTGLIIGSNVVADFEDLAPGVGIPAFTSGKNG